VRWTGVLVLIPEVQPAHWWQGVLYNQRGFVLQRAIERDTANVVICRLRYPPGHGGRPGRRLTGRVGRVGLKSIAHAWLGEQPAGPGRVRFELAPQLRHVEPQVAGRVGVSRAPHLLEQVLLGEQLAGVAQQHLEQVPFGRGQPGVRARHRRPGPLPGVRMTRLAARVHDQVPSRIWGCSTSVITRRPTRAHPGQQLLHTERLGHVVVRARVEGLHLSMLSARPDSTMMGAAVQPAVPVSPPRRPGPAGRDPGMTRSGGVLRGLFERLGAGRGGMDLILTDPQVDLERAQYLGLVVDDQDGAHRITVSRLPAPRAARSVMVSPPPGVSSRFPACRPWPRSGRGPGPAPARHPRVLSVSPSRGTARNIRSRAASGIPGPPVHDAQFHRSPRALAVSSGGDPAGEYRSALAVTVGDDPLQDRRVDPDLGQRAGHLHHHGPAAGPRSSSDRETISSRSAGRGNTDSAPACSLLMSSRLSTRCASRSSDSSAVASNSSRSSSAHCTSLLAQAGHGGLGRGQGRAQVMADRGQQRGPHPVGFGDGPGGLGFRGEPLLFQRGGGVGGERAEHPAVAGGQGPPRAARD